MNTPPLPPLKSSGFSGDLPRESGEVTVSGSIHHNASKYAIIAIAGSFGVNFLANLPEQRGTQTAYIISLIAGVLFISAFPAGIIALCGIKKHGPRKLLWRGLIGVLLPVIAISLGVAAFQGARSAAARIKAQADAAQSNPSPTVAPSVGPDETTGTQKGSPRKP